MRLTLLFAILAFMILPMDLQTKPRPSHTETGIASYYHDRFQGRKTANGERFDQNALSAAHKTLPFGTIVRVTRPDTGNSVVVRINDRGPFIRGRVIDLSREAARELGMIHKGVVPVKVEVLSFPTQRT